MKLVTFLPSSSSDAPARPGVLAGDNDGEVLDLPAALSYHGRRSGRPAPLPADMIALISRADDTLPAIREVLGWAAAGELPAEEAGQRLRLPVGAVRMLAPVPRPLSMRDGYAFRQHVEAARRNRGLPMIPEFDHFPIFYYTNHLSVVGPGPVHVRRDHLDKLDFELEAAVVLGRGGRDLDLQQADATIFGLMVMNDWSARGMQMEEMKLNLGPAKGKDFATALGPYLVPVEDLLSCRQVGPRGSHFKLAMRCEVNGTEVARGNVADMSWTFAEIIARASYGVTLHPGEVIGSGTVGTGCFLETNGSKVFDNWWLKPGDRVVCEIEALGRLENVVVLDEPAAPAVTGAAS